GDDAADANGANTLAQNDARDQDAPDRREVEQEQDVEDGRSGIGVGIKNEDEPVEQGKPQKRPELRPDLVPRQADKNEPGGEGGGEKRDGRPTAGETGMSERAQRQPGDDPCAPATIHTRPSGQQVARGG